MFTGPDGPAAGGRRWKLDNRWHASPPERLVGIPARTRWVPAYTPGPARGRLIVLDLCTPAPTA
jgi:hypothetical protein